MGAQQLCQHTLERRKLMFELKCLTNDYSLESHNSCDPDFSIGSCSPSDPCGPDYGTGCMPGCDPADDY